jgi:predicted MFS family arabinose efflux permease
MLINRSGTMVLPFMTIYCTQKLHFSIGQTGFVMAMFGVGAIVGAFFGGRITDKFGFYHMQLAALISGGIMFITLSFFTSFFAVALGSFVLSVCNESFRPANAAAIAAYSEAHNRTRSYSLNRLAINLGWAFGGALGGYFASVNYDYLFWVDGATNITAAVLLFFLLPKVKTEKIKEFVAEKKIVATPYKDKVYLFFIFLTILYAACFFQMFTMQPVFFKTQWHFTERFIGVLMMINGLIITFVEMVLVHNLEGKRDPGYYIRRGVLLLGIGFVSVNVLPPAAWSGVICIVLITFAEMISMPFMNTFWISRSKAENRGQYAALYTIAWSIGQIIAPTAGSILIANGGYDLLWWVVFAVCVLIFISYFFLDRKQNVQRGTS